MGEWWQQGVSLRGGVLEQKIRETIASFHVAQLYCKELGLQNVILEGDARSVVEAINGNCSIWSSIGHLVKDTRLVL
jgi:hypothetical protein